MLRKILKNLFHLLLIRLFKIMATNYKVTVWEKISCKSNIGTIFHILPK